MIKTREIQKSNRSTTQLSLNCTGSSNTWIFFFTKHTLQYYTTCSIGWILKFGGKRLWCCCVCMYVLSLVWLFAIPWTVARQAPLSTEFSRLGHWSGLSFPSPRDPNPGIELLSPALQAYSLPVEPTGMLSGYPKCLPSDQVKVIVYCWQNYFPKCRMAHRI